MGSLDITIREAYDGVRRPECILCTGSAGLFVSHNPVGVQRITPSGRREFFGRKGEVDPAQFTPNGIALTGDGRLLIANTGFEGGLWQVDRRNEMRPLLMEADGVHLYPANFVLADAQGRYWLTVSTRRKPRDLAYNAATADGYVVLIDDRGARIVADGLGYANECRLSNDGGHLHVNETFLRRVSRFPVREDGSLGLRETFCQLGEGDFPDGGTFDAEGHYWITSVVSNRLYRVAPGGEPVRVLDDGDAEFVARIEAAYRQGTLTVEMLYADMTSVLKHISCITFGGPDLRTAYLGTLKLDRIPAFKSPVPGQKPAHWHWEF